MGATPAEWRRDLESMTRDVTAIHPDPFSRIGELEWKRTADALKQDLDRLSEPERVVRLMQLIALLGDGHTQVDLEWPRYSRWYPLRIREFSDGLFVTSAHVSQRDLAGAEVLTIAGHPAREVVDAARTLFGADNDFDRRQRLYAVHSAFLMQGLGFAGDDGRLTASFRTRKGVELERELVPRAADEDHYGFKAPSFEWQYRAEVYGLPFDSHADWISAFQDLPASAYRELDTGRPLFLQHLRSYTRRAVPESDAYYVQFNQTDDTGMVGYMAEAFAEIDRQRPRRLIIDIRRNFGGDGSVVNRMIRQFIRRKSDRPWQELYLLVGPKTFSAAMAVIDAFTDHTDVTLVGEPAGAPLNFFGDAESRPYPDLGLSLHVSARRHQMSSSEDRRPHVAVDVPAPMSFADYSAGRDPAVDPILEGAEMRSIPLVALAQGGEAARRVHARRRERFGNLSWFRPPDEEALRFATFELTALGRHEDAVEAARLNTELHPFVWNTWFNLGGAQAAAGGEIREQRLQSYRCVMLLAPTNWNVPLIEELFERIGATPAPPPGCPVQE